MRPRIRPLVTLIALAGTAGAVQVRAYQASRHDRFTGFPANPAWNETAWFDSRSFAGVGWCPNDSGNKRQLALVSPIHMIFARHYVPGAGTSIRFLSLNGGLVNRSIASWTAVKNDSNQDTDLALVVLNQPLLAQDGVPHFPYLHLSGENAYLGAALDVCGWQARIARGRIAVFRDLYEEPVLHPTRMFRFDYVKSGGNQDDCYVISGDSGSPSFATVDGHPALVGFHTAAGDDRLGHYNHDTLVPHYITKLNLLMAPQGYQMTPTDPPPTALAATAVRTPAAFRQAQPATCRLDLTNTGTAAATNVNAALRFDPAQAPSSLDAPGWTVTNGEPGEFLLHRATLAAGETNQLTATWTQTGNTTRLPIQLDHWADGVAVRRHDFSTLLVPHYQEWADGLALPAPDADGDGDGIPNLLEYAFGGDPLAASVFSSGGAPMQPDFSVAGGTASMEFPVRDDAEERGITYVTEFSDTLENGSWSTDPPPGVTVEDSLYPPDSPGFLRRVVTFDASAPRRFCRVRVEVNEEG